MKKAMMAAVLISTAMCQAGEVLVVSAEANISQKTAQVVSVVGDTLCAVKDPAGSAQKIYLKFDASGLKSDVVKVDGFAGFAVKMKYPRSATAFLIVGEGAADWAPETITWGNAPGNNPASGKGFLPGRAVQLGAFPVLERGVSKTVELEWGSDAAKNALIEALNTGNRQATVVMVRPTTKACKFASLKNMERGAHPFELTVK